MPIPPKSVQNNAKKALEARAKAPTWARSKLNNS